MTIMLDVQRIGQRALSATNKIFEDLKYNIRVQMLTEADMDWCVHMTREQPRDRRLPWDRNGHALKSKDAFNFSFKILDADNRPAGACLCQFYPAAYEESACLNVEMLQNFHIQNSILDGNTLKFTLFAAVLFMADTGCTGLRLMSPVNDKVADYYINEHGFKDILGDKGILYRDAEGLLEWFRLHLVTLDDTQQMSDN